MTNKPNWLQLLICSFLIFTTTPANAQITPDNTLGAENSRLTPNILINGASADRIDGGATRGSNLFHSFTQFSINNGQRVYFSNPVGVENIFTRVTGKEASNIFGTLGVNGTANLFLINPNGILFGKNAQLDIRGSFLGTTANAIQFGNQGIFSATNPAAPPLLTVNPSALLFNQIHSGEIAANQASLIISPGQRLALIGGDIELDRTLVRSLGGRVELAAFSGTGAVGLNPDSSLSIPTDLPRADIALFNSQIGITAGNNSSIAVHARNLDLSENSQIVSQIGSGVGANRQGGNITLDATGVVQIKEGSRVRNIVSGSESGNAGDILINTGSLFMTDDARLSASVFGQGNGGSVIINARDQVSLDNRATIFGNVEKTGKGNAGNIRISTGSLSLTNGAGISANIYGQGNTGDILIDARDRLSLGKDVLIINGVQDSAIGTGGNIRINTGSLSLSDDAIMRTYTFGQGNAGDVIINARDQVSLDNDSDISSLGKRSNGGNIRINTGSLSATGGGELYTTTSGSGKAGDIFIDARDFVSFEGGSSSVYSRAVSRVASGATGQGGNIAIATRSLLLDNGAQLGTLTYGQGNAGNIALATGSLLLDNSAQLGTLTYGQGNAGNITIDARDQVVVTNGANIINNVQNGRGKGGDIRVTTGTLKVTNAVVQAAALRQGNVGNVVINARDRVELAGRFFDEQLGSFVTIGSFVASGTVGNAGNVEITTGTLSMTDGAQVSASTQGKGNAGNVIINARDRIFLDSGNISSGVNQNAIGKGGDIFITTGSLEQINASQIDASTFGDGDAGNVTIVATQPITVAGISQETKKSSAIFSTTGDNPAIAGTGPTIVGKGKGGNITISAPQLTVRDGAVIDARTFNDQPGGNINITLDSLQLLNGGQIFTTSESSGSAGTITINAKNQVEIAGTDPTYSSRLSQFPRRVVQISPNSGLYVRASETGAAGNINLTTPRLTLDNQGTINAESNTVDGGNINLNSDLLLLRRNSSISATAGLAQNEGNGGNININSSAIVAVPKENSDIRANAFQGRGGNVTIKTDGLFGIVPTSFPTPQSDITASSQLGIQGQINIIQPDVQPTQGLIELPFQVIDASNQIAQDCPRSRNAKKPLGNFIVTGRGIPPNATQPLNGTLNLTQLATLDSQSASTKPNTSSIPKLPPTSPTVIVEAQGWVKTPDGKIMLVAQVPTAPTATTTSAACPVSR